MADWNSKYVDVTIDGTKQQIVNGIYQYDHGIFLRVHGVPTNVVWQFQFGYRGSSESITAIGTVEDDAVIGRIPDTLLMQRREVICYLYYEDENYGMTIYEIYLPLSQRIQPETGTYTPEQVDTFNTLVNELQGMIDEMDAMGVATVEDVNTYLGIS